MLRLTLLLSCISLLTGQNLSPIVQFHGSGTSNPARCFWSIMEDMRGQTKVPTWSSYRSTSSGPGLDEFMGNITHPFNHFASADYPLPKNRFDILANAGQEMIHLPVLMGAIGIFHSVPTIAEDLHRAPNVNLTSCLIARIYNGEIDDWTHPEIAAINHAMDLPIQLNNYGKPKEDQSFPIKVAHRVLGSSSTYAFTSYLHKSCPEHWGEDLVGSSISWPMEGSDSLVPTQGTSAMLSAIHKEPGTIGYADAGLGLDEGVAEVALKMEQAAMKTDFFLTSENALNKDGLTATLAADGASIPSRGDVDWSGVDLINQVEGYIYAWPMVLMTYVMVRKDLPTFIEDPRAQSFLVAFLKALYDPTYMQKCEKEYLFLPVKGDLQDMALRSIDMLELSPGAPEWKIETDVMMEGGQNDYVISTRRKLSSAIQQDHLTEKVQRAEGSVQEVMAEVEQIQSMSSEIRLDMEDMYVELMNDQSSGEFGDMKSRVDASLGIAIAALSLWFLSLIFMCFQQLKIRDLEARPPQIQPIYSKKRKHHQHHEEDQHTGSRTSDGSP